MKTNFTKVEEYLDKGLQQLNIQKLNDEVDALNPKNKSRSKNLRAKKQLIIVLIRELNRFAKKDPNFYRIINFDKEEVKKLLVKEGPPTKEEWKTILALKEKVEAYKQQTNQMNPPPTNDALVEGERLKSVNKRFNVSDKWLPLT